MESSMKNGQQSSSDLAKGPFTATRLWNEVVREMKANLPTRRRRWRLKVYDDVFVASEALDWLHDYLKKNPKFGPTVARRQAIQLCQKFLRSGVIEDARGKDYNSSVFEDNGQLYRFINVRYSPYKPVCKQNNPTFCSSTITGIQTAASKNIPVAPLRSTPFTAAAPSRTPLMNKLNVLSSSKGQSANAGTIPKALRRRSGSQSRKRLLEDVIMNPAVMGAQPHNRRSLADREITEVWWSVAKSRLSGLLNLDTCLDLLKQEDYDISCVRTNAQEQSLSKATDVFPQWLSAAMKCLIQWPNNGTPEESLPQYPGFERDVFRAVVEYFGDLVGPLVEPQLLNLFRRASECIRECKLTAVRSLQYCCLFLQPFSRHVLQVLVRFIVRLSSNHSIVLSDDLPTRELLIQTFSTCIFGVSGDVDVIRILYFMIEHFPEYFKSPEGLQFQVQQRILFLESCRGNKFPTTSTSDQTTSVAYCERVTKKECEEISRITSQRSLRDLLDTIIENEAITEKGRQKQLKQFEKSYPQIYHARFSAENAPFPRSSGKVEKSEKIKQAIRQPLLVLRNLR